MKLCLTQSDERRWIGLVEIAGELFQVTLFPGSMTKDWEASLQPTLFVELDSPKLIQAIERGKEELDHPQSPPISQPTSNKKCELSPELMEQINSILNSNDGEEDGTNSPQECE